MKIKDLPKLERPYERLENYGAESLSDAELLAIIIRCGTREETSVQVAQRVLSRDEEGKGISFLKEISVEEIQKEKGIGRIKAIQLRALGEIASRMEQKRPTKKMAIKTPEDIRDIFMCELKNLKQEVIKTVLLDNKSQIIKVITNSIGNANANIIEAREIFREPIRTGASRIVLVHNHPTGDPKPSPSDINFTKKMAELGELMGIEVIDHIIIGDGTFSSLKRLDKF